MTGAVLVHFTFPVSISASGTINELYKEVKTEIWVMCGLNRRAGVKKEEL